MFAGRFRGQLLPRTPDDTALDEISADAGLLAGEVRVCGQNGASWSRAAFARHLGYVPQAQAGLFPFSVEDMVLMGRAARVGRFSAPGGEDRRFPFLPVQARREDDVR